MAQCELNLSMHRPAPALSGTGHWLGDGLGQAVAAVVARLFAWRDRARSRRQLGELNERLLRDIGLDRASAQAEADKSFWRN